MKLSLPCSLFLLMRTINHLSVDEVKLLRQTIRSTTTCSTLKRRCQCVLYSFHGLAVTELMAVFNVSQRTVYNWLDRWEQGRLPALEDKAGRGTKARLTVDHPQDRQLVQQALRANPFSTQQALQAINQGLPKPISPDTLRRFIKKAAL